jgi:two-component system chemotaxis response regulator CheB
VSARLVRVMIVEDSLVVRQLLSHIVGRDPRFELAAAVATAEEALAELERVRPDVISMDIRLPGMDGLEATRQIMSTRPTPIVVIADAVEDYALRISMNALRAGALSVVEKPVGLASSDYERVAETITTQLYIMSSVPVIRRRNIGATAAAPARTQVRPSPKDPGFAGLSFLALAASTGGPPAIAKVLSALPAAFPAPVFIVQHMGAAFMEGFAQWLNGLSPISVRLAEHDTIAQPGVAYVAPGDRHLQVGSGGRMLLSATAPIGGQRPAANVLFSSLAQSAGSRAVGVLLTGMGQDGATGLLEMRKAGAYTFAEDESTAVVFGMPAAAAKLKAAREVLPLDAIGPRIALIAQRVGA